VVPRGELPAALARILSLLREPYRADVAAEIFPPLAPAPRPAE
jgi:hypothetical protein